MINSKNINKLLGLIVFLSCQISHAETQSPVNSEPKPIEAADHAQTQCIALVRKNDNPTTEDLNERYILEDKLGVDTASKDREKLVSDCISKLRNDNDDKSFHTLVVKELRNTKYWNESAAWLKKNNLYELVVNDICVNNPKVKRATFQKSVGGALQFSAPHKKSQEMRQEQDMSPKDRALLQSPQR